MRLSVLFTHDILLLLPTYKNDNSNRFAYLGNDYKTPFQARKAIEEAYERAQKEHPERFEKKSRIDVRELPYEDSSEFYPTPDSLIGKMLSGIDWTKIETVLEPEAGKGDLVQAVKKAYKKHCYNERNLDIDCIEKIFICSTFCAVKGFV